MNNLREDAIQAYNAQLNLAAQAKVKADDAFKERVMSDLRQGAAAAVRDYLGRELLVFQMVEIVVSGSDIAGHQQTTKSHIILSIDGLRFVGQRSGSEFQLFYGEGIRIYSLADLGKALARAEK